MLVHRRVTPQQYVSGTHLCNWVKRDKVEQSSLSKETMRQARLEPWTSRSAVRVVNRSSTHASTYIPWDITFHMATATILNLNILVQASGHTKVLGKTEKICPLKEGKSISEHVKSTFSQGSMPCVKPVQVAQHWLYKILLRTLRMIALHYIEDPL